MKRSQLLIACLMCLSLFACGTPREQYTLSALAFDGASVAVASLHAAGKVSDANFAKAQADESIARQNLATAYKWIVDNPTLAKTPGVTLPGINAVDITTTILNQYIQGLNLVPIDVPPATAPASQPSAMRFDGVPYRLVE